MAFTSLPLFAEPKAFRYNITLSGVNYILAFRYATRNDGWYLSIYLRDETPIRLGVRIVVNYPLFLNVVDSRLPPGLFLMLRTDDNGDQPLTIDDFNGSVKLMRLTSDSIPQSPSEDDTLKVEAA